MTVATNFRNFTRPFSGYVDPSLPTGAYIAQGVLTGDASGGFAQMNFLFQFGQTSNLSQSYSLEHFAAETNSATTEEMLFQTNNMDRITPQIDLPPTRWSVPVISDGAGSAVARLEALSGLPLWLGAPNTPNLECILRVQFINTLNRVYTVMIQGYIWGSRSTLAPGGPQRPPFGFLGN